MDFNIFTSHSQASEGRVRPAQESSELKTGEMCLWVEHCPLFSCKFRDLVASVGSLQDLKTGLVRPGLEMWQEARQGLAGSLMKMVLLCKPLNFEKSSLIFR